MQIFIQRDGIQHGPYSIDAARALLNDGSFQPSDLAWHEGAAQWAPLASIPGILGSGASAPHELRVPPRTSALAIWSLVLGALGIFTLGIPSIPAVICGHLSHSRIRKSGGTLTGSGLAIAGFVLGYIGLILIPLLIAGGYVAGTAAITNARRVTTLATAVAIESAVENFYTEYGTMPSEKEITDTVQDVSLVKTLHGEGAPSNTRNIRFLSVKEARLNKNGLDPVTFKLFDPWGNGFQVVLDTQYKEEILVTRGGKTETVKGHHAAVYSIGKDGIAGTADDVQSW